jgi:hypothetical protein
MIAEFLESVNGSRLLVGILMIFMNLASRFIVIDLSKTQKQFFDNAVLRQVLIFSIAFVGTRDVVIALVLTAVFTILVDGLLNEKSPLYMLPRSDAGLLEDPSSADSAFGLLRVISGVPDKVQNPAYDPQAPVIGTT